MLDRRHALAAVLVCTSPAQAQRATENAVTAAEDAFGTSIGRETIGLYSAGSVRGFSANAAGNARIDSLYFDAVWSPVARIRQSTTIRVGLSAQGFPFPAPTGIIDYALKRPGREASLSSYTSIDSYGALVQEIDFIVPLSSTLSLGGGIGLNHNEFYNATDSNQHIEGIALRWTPSPDIVVQPFYSQSDYYGDEAGATFIPSGAFLPSRIARRRFDGPQFVQNRSTAVLFGGTVSLAPATNWLVRAGAFRTYFDDKRIFANLLLDLRPDGRADQLIIADPPAFLGSTSGELRAIRSIPDGPRLHIVTLSARARDRRDRYAGSDFIDLGPTVVGERVDAPRPAYRFTEQNRDRVRQVTGGIAYEGRWKGIGEIALGVQKTNYRKRIVQPGLPDTSTRARPWLFNASVAVNVANTVIVYGGYTRGLEESGVAPDNAINRAEALPAIRTSQRDAGVRWAINPKLKVIAGVFDVRKPYFNLDEGNLFTLLGDVKNQGVEASLAGALTSRLDVVAGAVLLRARVTGEGVELGRVGKRPVGQTARNLQLNLDWRPPVIDGVSLDLGVVNTGRRTATRDNLVAIPARTLVDVGGRYRFKLGSNAAQLRLEVSNLFDTYGYDLRGSGAYDIIAGRVGQASLAVDF